MAWNPNIPTVTNRVQDDLNAIRENFQVLDAHLADTNNPHNVQAQQVPYSSGVAGFSPADVKAALDALAGVRIVEMGSNANGYYARWENGLQVCWHVLQSIDVSGAVLSITWTFPAIFAAAPVVLNFARHTTGSYRYAGSATPHFHFGLVSHTTISNSHVLLAIYRTADAPGFQSGDHVTFSPIAIGRYK